MNRSERSSAGEKHFDGWPHLTRRGKMARKIIIATVAIIGLLASYLIAGDVIVSFNRTTVSSHTPVMVMGWNPSRKQSGFYNSNATYDIYITTWLPVELTSVTNSGAFFPLTAGQVTDDDFYVYKSSWYATSSTGTLTNTLYYMEKE